MLRKPRARTPTGVGPPFLLRVPPAAAVSCSGRTTLGRGRAPPSCSDLEIAFTRSHIREIASLRGPSSSSEPSGEATQDAGAAGHRAQAGSAYAALARGGSLSREP